MDMENEIKKFESMLKDGPEKAYEKCIEGTKHIVTLLDSIENIFEEYKPYFVMGSVLLKVSFSIAGIDIYSGKVGISKKEMDKIIKEAKDVGKNECQC